MNINFISFGCVYKNVDRWPTVNDSKMILNHSVKSVKVLHCPLNELNRQKEVAVPNQRMNEWYTDFFDKNKFLFNSFCGKATRKPIEETGWKNLNGHRLNKKKTNWKDIQSEKLGCSNVPLWYTQ